MTITQRQRRRGDVQNDRSKGVIVTITVAGVRFLQLTTTRITRVRVVEAAPKSHVDQEQERCELWQRIPHGPFLK